MANLLCDGAQPVKSDGEEKSNDYISNIFTVRVMKKEIAQLLFQLRVVSFVQGVYWVLS